MQTPKTRNGSNGEIPQKASPAGTPRPSGATSARASSEKSPKVSERRSPRSPAKEKKRPSKIAELESQLSHAKEELKKAKEDLTLSVTRHTKAARETDEAAQQIVALSARLDESQRQLADLSQAEEARLLELKQISQERDKAWQSELETMQNQHSTDLTEIQILKQQIETLTEFEKSQTKLYGESKTELQALKNELESQVQTNESLKAQIKDIQKSEIETKEISEERQQQLELAKQAIEKLEASICQKESDMEASSDKIKSLEASSDESLFLRAEIEKLKLNREQQTETNNSNSNSEIQTMNEWEEKVYELEFEVQNKNAELDNLKMLLEGVKNPEPKSDLSTRLMDKETELQSLMEENETLKKEIQEMKSQFSVDREKELQNLKEENEILKNEIWEMKSGSLEKYEAVLSDLEIAKAAEQDVKMRLSYVTDEADKSSRRAARVAEQLDAAQAVTSEMESELKRLRIQSDQWRKAAEAAAAALTGPNNNNNNGRLMERSGSLDADYNSIAGKMINSPFSDDLEFESPRKKSGGVLRRMSGLWKKSPK